MAKQCIIRFSSDNIGLNGKPLEEVRSKALERMRLDSPENVSNEVLAETVDANFPSKRDAEKAILQAICSAAFSKCKTPADANIIMEISAIIKDADDFVVLEIKEFEGLLRDNFEKLDKKPWWLNCPEFFKQLSPLVAYDPNLNKEEKKD